MVTTVPSGWVTVSGIDLAGKAKSEDTPRKALAHKVIKTFFILSGLEK